LPEPLRQAALDAVNSWAYRPFVLNRFAVEMQTIINAIFKLERPQDKRQLRLGFVSAGLSPTRQLLRGKQNCHGRHPSELAQDPSV
jgi:hypothetical protein